LGVALELEGSLAASASLGDGGGGGGGAGPKEVVHATMSSSRRTCSTALSSLYSSAIFFLSVPVFREIQEGKNGNHLEL
jgi:hypothetical protein